MRVAEPNQTVAELLTMLDEPNTSTIFLEDENHSAVLLSRGEYNRMRGVLSAEFDRAWSELSRTAEANGLTEEKLAEILAEIDAEIA